MARQKGGGTLELPVVDEAARHMLQEIRPDDCRGRIGQCHAQVDWGGAPPGILRR
ncbi:hypothetical protein [Streptomyces pseudovenezuelae]|uniref:hypothetical protein n=1 Tax=Streptomyces pseudovenezuelae TaxID=67350 RepID=UPI002E32F87D|nr:hypothetical protein [Streptomyces pseudovenezuelae]